MFDLVIDGGTVVLSTGVSVLDVGIRGGKIAALAVPGTLDSLASKVIDASGCYVMPGAVDPHVHIFREFQGYLLPHFDVTSVAAAYGGTTTFIDFSTPSPGMGVLKGLEERRAEIEGKTAIDYSIHAALLDPSAPINEEIRPAIEYGVPSFKIYTDEKRVTQVFEDSLIFSLFEKIAYEGGVAVVHAENASLAIWSTKRLLEEGKTDIQYFPQGRPAICEAESVKRIIFLAEQSNAAVYFVHLSTREAIESVAEARAKGLPIYCETCPHYLAFNDEVYLQEEAIQFIRFPPIRDADAQAALWRGVIDGTIDAIGTDHVALPLSMKRELSAGRPFNKLPGGMGQIENRLILMYSEGVARGKITINRLVELVAANPAKIFGLYPQKGIIAVGSDADIVLLDPKPKGKITSTELHMGLDYTVFEGWEVTGSVLMTILKGKVIIKDGQYLGSLSDGHFVKRRISRGILSRGYLEKGLGVIAK